MKKLVLLFTTIISIFNLGCYKKPKYDANKFKANITTVDEIKTITWDKINIAGANGIEIQMCKNALFTDSLLTQTVVLLPNNDVANFELPNIVLDSILKSATIFFRVNILLNGRKIASNIIPCNGNAISKLPNTFVHAFDENTGTAVILGNNQSIFFYNIKTNTQIPILLNGSILNNSGISFSTLFDSIPVMITQNEMVSIYDMKTGVKIITYPNNTPDRCFNNGAIIVGNQLISQYSPINSNILNISKYDLETNTWLDSINLNKQSLNFNILLSNNKKFIVTRSNGFIYKINIDGKLQVIKSVLFPNAFNRLMAITKTDKILIEKNSQIFELDSNLLETPVSVSGNFPARSSAILSDNKNYYTILQTIQRNQQIVLDKIVLIDALNGSVFKTIKYDDNGINFFNNSMLVLENRKKILVLKQIESNTYLTEKSF